MPAPSEATIVSCLIQRGQDEVLICTPQDESDPQRLWLFPTGVANKGESPEAAMRRVAEAAVGLSIDIQIGQPPVSAEYQGKAAVYRFYIATVRGGQETPRAYRHLRWVRRGQLCEYNFAPAYAPVAQWFAG